MGRGNGVWVGAMVAAIVLALVTLVIIMAACCYLSGSIAQAEEAEQGVRRS